MFNNLSLDQLKIYLVTKLSFQACHTLIDKATGVDVVEIPQVGAYVHRKAVHRHIAACPHTYGAYLSCSCGVAIYPHARRARYTARLDAPLLADAYDGLLQRIDILAQTYAELLQVENGVTHHLTRAVECHVATAVDVVKFGANRTQIWLRDEHICAIAAFA